MDVIEFLVQNGADLEAKTKNGETPYDICEDPDLKNRILQLKSEIESKKAVSSGRLRRSHSQNTRSHSIRRTSIREKSQIAKREAIAEARIWQEKSIESIDIKKDDSDIDSDAQFYPESNRKPSSESPIDINNIDVQMDSCGNDVYHHPSASPYSTSSPIKNYYEQSNSKFSTSNSLSMVPIKKPDNQQLDSYYPNYYNEYYENNSFENNGNSHSNGNECPSSDGVKVEIRVTVNTTPNSNLTHNSNAGYYNPTGTLIDLKKQRSEKHRNSLTNSYTEKIKPSVVDHSVSISSHKPSLTSLNMNYNSPNSVNTPPTTVPPANAKHSINLFDSPSTMKKRFRGNPSELIGEHEKKGCCVIC